MRMKRQRRSDSIRSRPREEAEACTRFVFSLSATSGGEGWGEEADFRGIPLSSLLAPLPSSRGEEEGAANSMAVGIKSEGFGAIDMPMFCRRFIVLAAG